MVATPTYTEGIPPLSGNAAHIYIGTASGSGVNVIGGLKRFRYKRVNPGTPQDSGTTKAAATIHQGYSNYEWHIELLSDCHDAFFATNVSGTDKAMDEDGDSYAIGYFVITVPIILGTGVNGTRTITITNGFALAEGGDINDRDNAVYEYDGVAQKIVAVDT